MAEDKDKTPAEKLHDLMEELVDSLTAVQRAALVGSVVATENKEEPSGFWLTPEQAKEQGRVGLNTAFDGSLATIAPQSVIDNIIADCVKDARKTYKVRDDRSPAFVDLYPSTAKQQQEIEQAEAAKFIKNDMAREQDKNLQIIDEQIKPPLPIVEDRSLPEGSFFVFDATKRKKVAIEHSTTIEPTADPRKLKITTTYRVVTLED